jgi:hypothetical protein
MAYKFQLGAARLSGSLVQEGNLEAQGSGEFSSLALNAGGITAAGAISGATTISGSSNLSVGGTIAAGNNTFQVDAAGAVTAVGVNAGGAITGATSIDGSGDLTMATITMSGFTVDGDGDTAVKSLELQDDEFISNESVTEMMQFSADGDIILKDGAFDFDVAAHDGTNGLKLGGTLVAASAAELNLLDGITRGSIVYGSGSNASARLAKGDAHSFLQSDGSDISYVTMSGDATLTAGVLSIGATKITDAMINNDVATELASGNGIGASDGVLSVAGGDGITAEANGVKVTPAQTTITSVLNSSLVIGTAADQEYIDFSTENQIHLVVNDTPVARAVAGTFIVDGNLHVSGTTTSVDSTTINISSSFTFEGPVDAHETILSAGTPTADITVMLPQYDTAETVHMAVLADATTDASSNVTAAEFALLGGGSSVDNTVALASGDGVLYNDGGTMKQVDLRRFTAKFAGNGIAATDLEMNLDINGLAAAKTAVAQTDLIAIADSADSNIVKKVTLSNFEDEIFGNISGDIAIAAGGAATIQATSVEGSMLNDNIISGQTELASGLASTDELMVSDAGVLKRMDMSVLSTFIGTNISADVQNVEAAGTLVIGVNYFSDMGVDGEDVVTLPASPSVGQSVKVKAPSDCSSARYITIARAGSQTIDGAISIRLESLFAAVELIYVAEDQWRVF